MAILPAPRQLSLFEKRCGGCHEWLSTDLFSPRGGNPNRLRSQCDECKNAAKRRYDETHRDQVRRRQHLYYRENAEACRERIRRSNAAKPEKYRAIHSAWKKANRDAVNASTHKRRARLASGGSWTASDWERVKARYDWRCLMCHRQEMTDGITLCFDHVVPLDLGGWNIISNAQPLCRGCNSRKHRQTLDLRPAFFSL